MRWSGAQADGTSTPPTPPRCANAGEARTGRYELWLFPVRTKGEGGPVVKNVEVKADGQVIYHKAGPWRSLTLLLPQNVPGQRYELSVDGCPPVLLDAGLQPVKMGNPREVLVALNSSLGGEGPRILVQNLTRPTSFPNPKEWAADLAALAQPRPADFAREPLAGLQRQFGNDVARSPLTLYAAALPHGMSGGFFKKGGERGRLHRARGRPRPRHDLRSRADAACARRTGQL